MTTVDNKTVVRRFYDECMNQGRVESVAEVMAPDFVDHSYALQGIAATEQFVRDSRVRFPELHFTIEELIAEGQVVAVRWVGQGAYHTGQSARWTGMAFYHLKNGKITAHWANVDQLSLRQQLGLAPFSE
jgi:predicted ester cyclase